MAVTTALSRSIKILYLLIMVILVQSFIELRFQKCGFYSHDLKIITNLTCRTRPLNRTTTLINMHADIVKPTGDLLANVVFYKQSDIKYTPFLINMTEDLCGYLGKKSGGRYIQILGDIFLPFTNINHPCPLGGEFIVKDLAISSEKIPQVWPTGNYRVVLRVYQKNHDIATIEFFFEIRENRPGRKKLIPLRLLNGAH